MQKGQVNSFSLATFVDKCIQPQSYHFWHESHCTSIASASALLCCSQVSSVTAYNNIVLIHLKQALSSLQELLWVSSPPYHHLYRTSLLYKHAKDAFFPYYWYALVWGSSGLPCSLIEKDEEWDACGRNNANKLHCAHISGCFSLFPLSKYISIKKIHIWPPLSLPLFYMMENNITAQHQKIPRICKNPPFDPSKAITDFAPVLLIILIQILSSPLSWCLFLAPPQYIINQTETIGVVVIERERREREERERERRERSRYLLLDQQAH